MAKLTVIQDEPTVAAIYAAIKAANRSSHRTYLGASSIGRPCARELWFMFRWVKRSQFDGRMLRLFNTGHLEEPRLIADLQSAGVEVLEVDPTTGEQWAIAFHGGHFRGHADGAALGLHSAPKTWHLLEFKTHNDKSFAKLQTDGVEKTKPEHVAQMQVYMHGLGLTRAYYLARNKNTDELYGERLRYDKKQAEYWIERAGQIIFAPEPPLPIGKDASFFQCKFCDFSEYCYRTVADLPSPLPEKNCRTCIHSTPKETGGWLCEKKGYEVEQDEGMVCKNHRFIPMLFPSLEFTHTDENLNVFYRSNTQKYINTEKGMVPCSN
ncbi:oxidoreductase [Acinetobacter sp. YH12099]|uniref:oxidoreductase n=1 Tax=Acinetobacter sp. YH12099 TaxID=2601088 RepID=UPI0015D1C140|nr:oxidoreductase [Acinetobacter sp. YH12099]